MSAVMIFAGNSIAQQVPCKGDEKRLHPNDECIPPALFNYLYCLQNSGGGKIEVTRKKDKSTNHELLIKGAGKGSGVVLKAEASGSLSNNTIKKATEDLQEKLDPSLATKCEKLAEKITGKQAKAEVKPIETAGKRKEEIAISFKFVKRIETTLTTNNHHCSHDCRGEPTRAGYEITLTVPDHPVGKKYELRDPKLECIGGPCGGWNQVMSQPSITPDKLKAVARFDVWSKPTTWKLSADYYEQQ